MINASIQNSDEFYRKAEQVCMTIRDIINDKLLKELAEKAITTITSGIDRQRSIDGGILKQNSPKTVAQKLGYKDGRQYVTGDKGNKYPIKLGKSSKAFKAGATVRALVDHGILRKPSTYQITRLGANKYEVSIRAVKSADPDDKMTRDKVAPHLQAMGYNFFGIGPHIERNVKEILEVELRKLGLK